MKRTKNRSILQVLKEGPEYHYGSETEEERDCCKMAEVMILNSQESYDLRKELLKELIAFKERIIRDGEAFSNAGESC